MLNNVHEWLSKVVEDNKKRTFFVRERETYADLMAAVKKRAVTLREKLKVKKGDVVALLASNTPHFIKSYFAILSQGAQVLMLDTGLTKDEHKSMMERTNCKLALANPQYFVENAGAKMVDIETIEDGDAKKFAAADMSRDDIAQLSFTSGSTGNPKIVALTHNNLLSLAENVDIYTDMFEPGYIIYGFLPLYHIYAVVVNIIAPLQMKCQVLLQPVLDPKKFLADFQEYKPNVFPAVPRVLEGFYKKIMDGVKEKKKTFLFNFVLANQKILKAIGLGGLVRKVQKPIHDIFGGEMKVLISAGATLKPHIRKFYERLGFVLGDCYGLTETTGPSNFNLKLTMPDGTIRHAGPVPGNEIEIRHKDKNGVGDIWVKGPLVMKGYLNNPEANAESFDKDGWFRTGDVGVIDKLGILTIKGRKKQLIVLDSGKNVYPDELEALFLQNDEILAAAVVERRIRDKIVPFAVFQVKEGTTIDRVKVLVKLSNLRIAPYKWVNHFAITEDELPMTSAKKVKHYVISKMLDEGKFPNRSN